HQGMYGLPCGTWPILVCGPVYLYLFFQTMLAESWYRRPPRSATWRIADLSRSKAFRGALYLPLPRTIKEFSGSRTKTKVCCGYQRMELFRKFLGQASGTETVRSPWRLIARLAACGLDLIGGGSRILGTVRSKRPTGAQKGSAVARSARCTSRPTIRFGRQRRVA